MLVRAERHRWIDGSMAQPLAVFFIFSKVQESGYSWATRISRFWVIRSGQCTSGPLFDARHTQKKNVNGAGTTFFSLVCSGHVADEGKVSPKAQIFSWILSLFFDESAVKCSPMTFFNWNSLHQWNVSSESPSIRMQNMLRGTFNLMELVRNWTSFACVFRVDVWFPQKWTDRRQ